MPYVTVVKLKFCIGEDGSLRHRIRCQFCWSSQICVSICIYFCYLFIQLYPILSIFHSDLSLSISCLSSFIYLCIFYIQHYLFLYLVYPPLFFSVSFSTTCQLLLLLFRLIFTSLSLRIIHVFVFFYLFSIQLHTFFLNLCFSTKF